MTNMSDLPIELAEEVLCRIPFKSLKSVRSTCKKWNNISKDQSFAKKYLGRQAKVAAPKEREFSMVIMMDFKVNLMSVNLHNNVESCFKREAKLNGVDDVSQVFHCDGLLLCIMRDSPRLMVCNPYWGKTRWIRTEGVNDRFFRYSYALGYDKSSKSHKILRFNTLRYIVAKFKIYDFKSDSWRVLDVTRDWEIYYYNRGVSVKGNTYWFTNESYQKTQRLGDDSFILSFDFTKERFGPRLPLPLDFHTTEDTLTLSSVRDEQLALLFQSWGTYQMEIWVTTKIEPNSVSWSSKFFLSVNMRELNGNVFPYMYVSFFIDEEKKVAVVFANHKMKNMRNVAYILGENGPLNEAEFEGSLHNDHHPLVCSYVSSLVQFN